MHQYQYYGQSSSSRYPAAPPPPPPVNHFSPDTAISHHYQLHHHHQQQQQQPYHHQHHHHHGEEAVMMMPVAQRHDMMHHLHAPITHRSLYTTLSIRCMPYIHPYSVASLARRKIYVDIRIFCTVYTIVCLSVCQTFLKNAVKSFIRLTSKL